MQKMYIIINRRFFLTCLNVSGLVGDARAPNAINILLNHKELFQFSIYTHDISSMCIYFILFKNSYTQRAQVNDVNNLNKPCTSRNKAHDL